MISLTLRLTAALVTCLLLVGGTILPGSADSAVQLAAGPISRQVSFKSGADRLYGTLELPAKAAGRRIPGALLIAGSGPSDRNGNEPTAGLTHMNTLRNFARALALAGLASLRYDKLGTGRTGIGNHPDPATADFNLYLNEARAAYRYLAGRPEIDPHRLVILGHSEGGLIGLILAGQSSLRPKLHALVLAAPPGLPILETVREQIASNLAQGVQSGQITQAQADADLAELDRIIAQLKGTGTLPTDIQTPGYRLIFNPANTRYLSQEEQYDPRSLAKQTPKGLPVLLLHGTKDSQISESDIHGVLDAFRSSGHTRVRFYDLAKVDHVFKEVPATPNPSVDYNNPHLPFSRGAVRRLTAFVRTSL